MVTTVIAWTVAGWFAISAVLVAASYRARRNLARERAARAIPRFEQPVRLPCSGGAYWQQLHTAIDLARRDFGRDLRL